jgi:hypothetical protein
MSCIAGSRRGRADLVFLGIIVFAAAVRLPGLATDFWLDEIWTLDMIQQRTNTALDVFTSIRHSNNHHLNTLYFYLLGEQEHWSVYRLHSLAAGIATVWLAFRIGARAGRLEALLASGLCATSYLLIHFSSEARGYAMAVFFSVAAFETLLRYRDEPRPMRAVLFTALTCLGFLSHLMFLHTFVAAAAWMVLVQLRGTKDSSTNTLSERVVAAARRMIVLFGPATLFLVWLYFADIRDTKIGEGPEITLSAVIVKALSYTFGGPPSGALAVLVAAFTSACWLGSIAWLARRGVDECVFYATVIVVSPVLSFVAMQPELFFVRYFLLGTTFGFIALAFPLAAAWRAGGVLRAGVAVLLALALFGNAVLVTRFYRYGRGAYLETMRTIAESTSDVLPTVAGDHRFRVRSVVRFYNKYLPPHQQLILVDQRQYPEWLLLHRIGDLGQVEPALGDAEGHRYILERTARYSDLSGWHWLAYRRSR